MNLDLMRDLRMDRPNQVWCAQITLCFWAIVGRLNEMALRVVGQIWLRCIDCKMTISERTRSLACDIATHYVPASAETHQTWSWIPFKGYSFARGYVTVPIVLAELHQVASALPILFERGPGGLLPVAVLRMGGQGPDVVSQTGDWTAFYVPSVLRAFPFACGLPSTKTAGQVLLNPHSDRLFEEANGTRLFDVTGAPSDEWQKVLTHMDNYQRFQANSAIAVNALRKGEILMPAQHLKMFEDPIFEGLLVIDRKAFRKMPLHRLGKLFQTGAMELVHAHFTSLETMPQIKRLTEARRAPMATDPIKTTVSGAEGFLDAMAMAYEAQEDGNVPYDRGGS